MKNLAEKALKVVQRLEKEKGAFDLFGIFLREDAPDVWDIVVAAPWLKGHTAENVAFIVNELNTTFTVPDWMNISRISILDQGKPTLFGYSGDLRVGEVRDLILNGVSITHGYVLSSRVQRMEDRPTRKKRNRIA